MGHKGFYQYMTDWNPKLRQNKGKFVYAQYVHTCLLLFIRILQKWYSIFNVESSNSEYYTVNHTFFKKLTAILTPFLAFFPLGKYSKNQKGMHKYEALQPFKLSCNKKLIYSFHRSKLEVQIKILRKFNK